MSWLSGATGRLPGLCGGDRSGSSVVSPAAQQEGENGRGGEPGYPCRSPGRTGATGAVVVVVGGLGGHQQEKWLGPSWAELRIAGLAPLCVQEARAWCRGGRRAGRTSGLTC